jgi:hypothetical protein
MFRDIAVTITPQSIHVGDRGAVIIGGRLIASPRFSDISMSRHGEAGNGEDAMKLHEEFASHFTYVALEGAKGHIR